MVSWTNFCINGINPSVALRIYEAYVLPKLLYGMEVLSLNQKQLGILSKFHIDNLLMVDLFSTQLSLASYTYVG
jgi:hypothetical protein